MFGGFLVYVASFTAVHFTPVSWLRHASDNNWIYNGNPSLDAIEFYGFWPLRQVYYKITDVSSRHLAESLPVGLPDNLVEGN